MKTIEIREQPVLSFRRTVQITANGVRYRLFRSLVTVVVVAVAVAFLMNILSESLVRRAIARSTVGRIAEIRCAATWVGRLTSPGTVEELLPVIAASSSGDERLRDAARRGSQYLGWFQSLDYARRRALLHKATGTEAFDSLQDAAALSRFRDALAVMRSVRLPSSLAAFEEFVRAWPGLKAHALAVRAKRAEGLAAVAARLQGRSLIEALADANGAFGEVVRSAGFDFPAATARRVAEQARRTLDVRVVEKSVGAPQMRQAVAGYLDLLPNDVSVRTLWRLLRDYKAASWYVARQKETDGDAARLAAERLVELAAVQGELYSLARAERMTVATGGVTGSGERMDWLVLASMLVCVVGISNSMLMSVTERFREIATLKCLGALDGFIMLMFVLEAAFLGAVGGLLGACLGTLLGVARLLIPFGSLVTASLPAGELAAAIAISSVLGVILAALASVYPSLKAARLAPMEAMRIQ
ncbi:MAG TPA: FtsX-like permease family protein [Planctomycetota bacterium]|nr:FtsX-like permease family protein [Planctomycetota bacterium]